MNKEDNEVYFLGKSKPEQHSKRIYLYTLISLAILGISGWIYYKSAIKKTDNTEMLQTVSIHPKKTILKRPRFDKDKDITAFYSWIAQNLKYPKGLENKDAKVVIKFTVNTAGKLEKFQILESPKEKAFEQAVISLLKESPQWAPAELTDGTKVNMEFTLPVSFKPENNHYEAFYHLFYQPDDDCILLCKNFNLSTSKRFNRLESLLHARRRIPSKREAAKIFIELQKSTQHTCF